MCVLVKPIHVHTCVYVCLSEQAYDENTSVHLASTSFVYVSWILQKENYMNNYCYHTHTFES